MSKSISASYKNEIIVTQTNVDESFQQAVDSPRLTTSQTFTNGTGSAQADSVYTDEFTLEGTQTQVLDLSSTSTFTDNFNDSAAMAKVKAVVIANPTTTYGTNTSALLVGAYGTNPWVGFFDDPTDVVKVQPGGQMSFIAPDETGMAVGTESCNLQFAVDGGSGYVTPQIVILGASS